MSRTVNKSQNHGFTLMEILMVIFIMGVAIAPMVQSFGTGISASNDVERMEVFVNQARGTLMRVSALNYSILNSNIGNPVNTATLFGSAAEAAKEDFSINGENYSPTVAITDAGGGIDGLLEIVVSVENVSFKTLKANY